MPLSNFSETFLPSDLDVLQNVYDRICAERGLTPMETTETENLAAELIRLRLLGMFDEEELYQTVNEERGLRRA